MLKFEKIEGLLFYQKELKLQLYLGCSLTQEILFQETNNH